MRTLPRFCFVFLVLVVEPKDFALRVILSILGVGVGVSVFVLVFSFFVLLCFV